MSVVTIYNQGKLQYVVLPSREVVSRYPDDDARSIQNAEQSPLWSNKEIRKRIQAEGTKFFKYNADKLDKSLSMDDSNGKMSDGFFLYLAYKRFQNQQSQAYFIKDEDVNNLLRSPSTDDIKKSQDFSKLLVLNTAVEYLVKAKHGEKLEYLGPGENPPGDTKVHTTSRGAHGYYPSEVDQQPVKPVGRDLEPEGIREVAGIQAPELDVDDDDDDDEEERVRGPKETDESFVQRMQKQGFRPVEELIKKFSKITKEEKDKLIREATLAGQGDGTDKTLITPNVVITNEEGKPIQITTGDGQIQAIQIYDSQHPERGGKKHLYFNPSVKDPTNKDRHQVEWRDVQGHTNKTYAIAYTKGQAVAKFNRTKRLNAVIPRIEKRCSRDITNSATPARTRDAALAVAIIHDTFRRVGKGRSKVYWDGKDGRPGPKKNKDGKFIYEYTPTFGVTSMQAQHIQVKGKKVYLEFLGKKGKLNQVEVTDDVVKKELISRKKASKSKTDKIIDVTEPTVNAYIKDISGGDFTAKDFRTYHGTRIAADVVVKIKIPKIDRAKFNAAMQRNVIKGIITNAQEWKEAAFLFAMKVHAKAKADLVGEVVAARLNNTKGIAIDKYINPEVFSDWHSAFEAETQQLMRARFPKDAVKLAQDWVSALNKKNYEGKGLDNPRKPKNWKKGDVVPAGVVPKPKKAKGKN